MFSQDRLVNKTVWLIGFALVITKDSIYFKTLHL